MGIWWSSFSNNCSTPGKAFLWKVYLQFTTRCCRKSSPITFGFGWMRPFPRKIYESLSLWRRAQFFMVGRLPAGIGPIAYPILYQYTFLLRRTQMAPVRGVLSFVYCCFLPPVLSRYWNPWLDIHSGCKGTGCKSVKQGWFHFCHPQRVRGVDIEPHNSVSAFIKHRQISTHQECPARNHKMGGPRWDQSKALWSFLLLKHYNRTFIALWLGGTYWQVSKLRAHPWLCLCGLTCRYKEYENI